MNTGRVRRLAIFGIVAPVLFVVLVIVGGTLTPDYSQLADPVSEIASIGQPYPWIQVANFVIFGLSIVAVAAALLMALPPRRSATVAGILLGIAGVSLVLTGLFRPDPFDPSPDAVLSTSGTIHVLTASLAFVSLIAAFLVFGRAMQKAEWRRLARFSTVVGLASAAALGIFWASFALWQDWIGFTQRLLAATFIVWLVTVSWHLLGKTAERAPVADQSAMPSASSGGM